MSSNKELLKVLKQKADDIMEEFETTELGKQWKGIKSTISLFENGSSNGDVLSSQSKIEIPKTIEDAVTWNGKILFALNRIKSGFVDDIVAELKRLNVDETDEVLKRKVSVSASSLKTSKKIGGRMNGIKCKYFIK